MALSMPSKGSEEYLKIRSISLIRAPAAGTVLSRAVNPGDPIVPLTSWPRIAPLETRWPRLADPVARMMALDGLTYLPDDILVKVDRAAMAVSKSIYAGANGGARMCIE